METYEYKGYEIQPKPFQLKDGTWDLNIDIMVQGRGQVRIRNFSAKNIFPTREEVTAHGVTFGKQIIDGQVENCSVSDL